MPRSRIQIKPSADWSSFDRNLMGVLSAPSAAAGLTLPNGPHPARSEGASTLSYKKIAKINEYGDDALGIPARPVFGPALAKVESEVNEALGKALRRATREADWQEALEDVAGIMLEAVQAEIDDYAHQPPLAQSTIDRKGHDQPWVETEALREHIIPVVLIDNPGSYDANVKRFRDRRGRFVSVR